MNIDETTENKREWPSYDETIEAIKGSIKKWADITLNRGYDKAASNCAICQLMDKYDLSCDSCPVYELLKKKCMDTPYGRWISHHELAHGGATVDPVRECKCPECSHLAYQEYKFLEELEKKYIKSCSRLKTHDLVRIKHKHSNGDGCVYKIDMSEKGLRLYTSPDNYESELPSYSTNYVADHTGKKVEYSISIDQLNNTLGGLYEITKVTDEKEIAKWWLK